MKKIRNFITAKANTATARIAMLRNDQRGIDIIVMIVVLGILVGIAAIFGDEITKFVKDLLSDVTGG